MFNDSRNASQGGELVGCHTGLGLGQGGQQRGLAHGREPDHGDPRVSALHHIEEQIFSCWIFLELLRELLKERVAEDKLLLWPEQQILSSWFWMRQRKIFIKIC